MLINRIMDNKMSSRIGSPEINPHDYNQLIIDEQKQVNGERVVFSTNSAETTGHPCTKNEIFYIFYKYSSRRTLDLNLKCKTIKLLERNRRKPRWPCV